MTAPPAGLPAMPPPGAGSRESSPILVAFAGPDRQRRVTVLFRAFMLIPHLIVLYALGIATWVVTVIGWFGALFTGHLPEFAADFLAGYVRWTARVLAYWMLLTDEYPPFSLNEADYPVQVALQPGRLNRLTVFFRLILAIPTWVVTALLIYGADTIVLFIAWLIVLASGRMPVTLYQALAAVARYTIRCNGYLLMLTGTYPAGVFGDKPDPPAFAPPPGYGWPGAGGPHTGGSMSGGYGAPGTPQGQDTPAWPGSPPAYGTPQTPYGPATPGTPQGPYLHGAPGTPQEQDTPAWPGSPPAYGTPQTPYGPATPGAPLRQDAPAWRDDAIPPWMPGGWPGVTAGEPYPVADTPGSWLGKVTRWPREAMPWRLILSAGAKRLVAGFLALGALLYGGVIAFDTVIISLSSGPSAQKAASQLHAAYAPLNQSIASYRTQSNACLSNVDPVGCFTAADRKLADGFAAFRTKFQAITMPPGPATTAAANLETATEESEHVLRELGSATTPTQYGNMLKSLPLLQSSNSFAQDYNALEAALNRSR